MEEKERIEAADLETEATIVGVLVEFLVQVKGYHIFHGFSFSIFLKLGSRFDGSWLSNTKRLDLQLG